MEPWIVVIAVSIVSGLIGIIYWHGQGRDDKQDDRAERNEKALSEHAKEDTRIHERVVRLETTVEAHDKELGKLRDMRHDILNSVTQTLAEWYTNLSDRINRK